jgi:hypothetical protein
VVVGKTLSWTVVFALLVQFAGAVWWASGVTAEIAAVKQKQAEYQALSARLQGVEIELRGLGTDVKWIRQALESERKN